jgi:hypothetical protein
MASEDESRKTPERESPYQGNKVGGATFVVGAEAANVITVAVQLLGQSLKVPQRRLAVQAYLSSDVNGDVVAAVPNGGVLSGAHGVVIPLLADTAFLLKSDATGKVDVQITDTTARTLYVVIVLPNGSLVVSPPVTFV